MAGSLLSQHLFTSRKCDTPHSEIVLTKKEELIHAPPREQRLQIAE
jgi:hypothetical protein